MPTFAYQVLGVTHDDRQMGIRAAYADLTRRTVTRTAWRARFADDVDHAFELIGEVADRERYDRFGPRDPVRDERVDLDLMEDLEAPAGEREYVRHELRRNFTGEVPKSERLEVLTLRLRVPPWLRRETLALAVPVFHPCSTCHGAGSVDVYPCPACDATGLAEDRQVVSLPLRSAVCSLARLGVRSPLLGITVV